MDTLGFASNAGANKADDAALEALDEYLDGCDPVIIFIWNTRDAVQTHHAIVDAGYATLAVRLWHNPEAQTTFGDGWIVVTDREIGELAL